MSYICYQCPQEGEPTIEEVRATRKAEIRAHAAALIAEADAHLTPSFHVDPPAVELQEIPQEQEVPTAEEAQSALHNDQSANDADLSVDATALGAVEDGAPVTVSEAIGENTPPKKGKKTSV